MPFIAQRIVHAELGNRRNAIGREGRAHSDADTGAARRIYKGDLRMSDFRNLKIRRWARSAASALLAVPMALAIISSSQVRAEEIVVTISRVKALEKFDQLSSADMLARVTIAGEASLTAFVKNEEDIRPNWVIRKNVPTGVHNVKVEILDKDVTKNDAVDINRIANKRDLDFQINTRNCRISGFTQTYRCKSSIVRAGSEKKMAEITFSVDVKR